MKHTNTSLAAALAAILFPAAAMAGEGMWLPEQLSAVADDLAAEGLELDPEVLGSLEDGPLASVINLGGCSASFVSEQGLIITNHHCAVWSLQYASGEGEDLVTDGFMAADQAGERAAGPGMEAYVTTGFEDVTEEVLGAVPEGANDTERFHAIDRAQKELVATCEEQPNMRCEVAVFNGGASYRLIQRMEYPDVRLVYAPPGMVGYYGGDIDNFDWPRHSGDWAIFRAYTDAEGNPAPYAEGNIPLQTPQHLTVSTAGLDEGDFVMVAGYPYETYRYRTSEEMAAEAARIPWVSQLLMDAVALFEAVGEADEDARVRLAPTIFGYNNYLKYEEGVLDGFEYSDLVEAAVAQDAELRAWLAANAEYAALAEDITALDARIAEHYAHVERDALLRWMTRQVRTLRVATTLYWLASERQIENDLDRMEGYQERDWDQIAAQIAGYEQTMVPEADRVFLAYTLRKASELPADMRIDAVDALLANYADAEDPADAAATDLLTRTALTTVEGREALLEADPGVFDASEDPIVQFAVALDPMRRDVYAESIDFEGAMRRLRPAYTEAIQAMAGREIYPDANGTLRVTFGHIQGFAGEDAVWYMPFTTAEGVARKHTGEEPFDAPDALLEAIAARDYGSYIDTDAGTLVVDFLSTMDTTGGNSGSATLNARGELCGLLFDGNYESLAADWSYDPPRTRSIHTDIRYVLWYMDRVDGADWILEELGITPQF